MKHRNAGQQQHEAAAGEPMVDPRRGGVADYRF
jgi:hypothetical protein